MRILLRVLLICCSISITSIISQAGERMETMPLNAILNISLYPHLKWKPPVDLPMNAHYIFEPGADIDRSSWLEKLHLYRKAIREGTPPTVLEMSEAVVSTRQKAVVGMLRAVRSGVIITRSLLGCGRALTGVQL